MKVHFIIPYSLDKNLGKAYNDAMSLIPEGDSACIMDYDVQLLTHDAGRIITQYATENPDKVLTCYTNRIHPLNTEQLLSGKVDDQPNMLAHLITAKKQANSAHTMATICNHFSGFLFVLPKEVWKNTPFPENGECLGVDTEWFKRLKGNQVPVMRMNRVYVWHTYRLLNGINNKEHLK